MFKNHRIVKGTTLLVALGLIMFVWTHARSVSPPASEEEGTDTVKAVKLRLTFAGGDTANVTQLEGGTIKIEKDGTKLEITPFIRDQGQVELRVSQAVQGAEVMQAVDTMLVGKGLAKLNKGNLPLSVQVLDVDKKLPAKLVAEAAAANQCCATTCSGVVICGVCVCTDCHVCMTVRWCECAAP